MVIFNSAVNIHKTTLKQKEKALEVSYLCSLLPLFPGQFILHHKFLMHCKDINTVPKVTFLFEGLKLRGLRGIVNLSFHLEYRSHKEYKTIFKPQRRPIFNTKQDCSGSKEMLR